METWTSKTVNRDLKRERWNTDTKEEESPSGDE